MSLFLLFGLLLFLQHAGHAEAGEEPVIEMEPFNGELSAIVGETASLLCKVTQGDPWPTVTWVKGPDNISVGGEGEELRFDPVKLEDGTRYRCTASNRAGSKTGEFSVTVYEYENMTVFTGDEVKIINPHGKNGIKLTWYNTNLMAGDSVDDKYKVAEWLVLSGSSANVKPGYDVDNKTGDLLIPSVTLDQEGWYTTFMMDPMDENKYGYTDVVVYGMNSGVVMEGLPNPVNESVEQIITCTIPEVRPENVRFNWSRSRSVIDGAKRETIKNGDTFKVISTLKYTFLRKMNGDKLKCEVGFEELPVDWVSAVKEINITYRYSVKTEEDGNTKPIRGQNKSMTCKITEVGNPASDSTFSWYKNNTKLHDTLKYTGTDTSLMTIHNLTIGDIGYYNCAVLNAAGLSKSEGSYHLNDVFYKPTLTMKFESDIIENATTSLKCIVDANPNPESMLWKFNGAVLGITEPIYEIDSVQRTQKGKYTCFASNEFGEDEAQCTLNVLYDPRGKPSVKIEKPNIAVLEEAKLTCETDNVDKGNPPGEDVVWRKDGHVILKQGQKSYTFTPNFVNASGTYSCALKNGYGETDFSSATTLTIEAPVMIEDEPSEWLFEPLYNDSSFIIQYDVSGSSEKEFYLRNSTIDMSETFFSLENKMVDGDFLYGQKEAEQVSWSWELLDEYTSCSNMTFFNGNYTFEAVGALVDRPSKQSRTFTINVQYPAILQFPEWRETSELGQPKTLHCDVCAEPPPTEYRWSFMGNTSMNAIGPHLNISNVTSEDIGWYTCTVVNVIKEVEYQKTFNVALEEIGPPHSPTVFLIKSRTARTLLVTWRVGFDGGYDLEWFELVYINATGGESMTKIIDCIENKICDHRIQNLEQNSTYRLKVRAKNKRPQGEVYSNYKETNGTTKILPQVKLLTPEITETYIHIKWEYKDAHLYQRHFDDNVVNIVVNYKHENAENYKRFPEGKNSTIPAINRSATIHGEFDTSLSYQFKYDIYEGAEKSKTEFKDTQSPDEQVGGGVDPGTIVGSVFGGIIFLTIVSLLVIFWIRQSKANGASETCAMDEINNGSAQSKKIFCETGIGPEPSEPAYEEINPAGTGGNVSPGYLEFTPSSPVTAEGNAKSPQPEYININVPTPQQTPAPNIHKTSAEEFHFQDWITRNDIPKHVADCLIKEAITSKGDLLLLNRTNIGDLQLKLGEVNRVLAAVQTLRPESSAYQPLVFPNN